MYTDITTDIIQFIMNSLIMQLDSSVIKIQLTQRNIMSTYLILIVTAMIMFVIIFDYHNYYCILLMKNRYYELFFLINEFKSL